MVGETDFVEDHGPLKRSRLDEDRLRPDASKVCAIGPNQRGFLHPTRFIVSRPSCVLPGYHMIKRILHDFAKQFRFWSCLIFFHKAFAWMFPKDAICSADTANRQNPQSVIPMKNMIQANQNRNQISV